MGSGPPRSSGPCRATGLGPIQLLGCHLFPAHNQPQPEAGRGSSAYLGQLRQDAVPPHGRQNVHLVCGLAGLPGKAQRSDPPWQPGPVGTRRLSAAAGYRQSPGATESLWEPSALETLRPPRAKRMKQSPRVWESPQSLEPGASRRPLGGGEIRRPLAVGGESGPGEPGSARTLQ